MRILATACPRSGPVPGLLAAGAFAAALAAGPATGAAPDPGSFDPALRTVLTGPAAADLVRRRGLGWASMTVPGLAAADRELTVEELDAFEALLAPRLAEELRLGRSPSTPAQYYRQYAAATLNGEPVIVVTGTHALHFSHGKDVERWKTAPIRASTDGGRLYWYTIYFPKSQTIMGGQRGRHREVVMFHLVGLTDCVGKGPGCERAL